MVLAHARKIAKLARHQREGILPFPMLRIRHFHVQGAPLLDKSKLSSALPLFNIDLQSKRLKERIAESDVSQPWFFQIDFQGEMVEFRTIAPVFTRDTRRQQGDFEAEFSQQRGERSIQLIAESATALLNDFVKNRFLVTNDFSTQRDIQIFERDGQHVGAMEQLQGLRSRH